MYRTMKPVVYFLMKAHLLNLVCIFPDSVVPILRCEKQQSASPQGHPRPGRVLLRVCMPSKDSD